MRESLQPRTEVNHRDEKKKVSLWFRTIHRFVLAAAGLRARRESRGPVLKLSRRNLNSAGIEHFPLTKTLPHCSNTANEANIVDLFKKYKSHDQDLIEAEGESALLQNTGDLAEGLSIT